MADMSSGAAGKFQDHYVTLGVETNSDSETIQAAYSKLAQKYHPNNPEFGDKAKFDSINMAFEVLSDPILRASFDKVKGVDHESGNPKFTGPEFFQALEDSAFLRFAIRCILYDRRRIKSYKPSLSLRHLEGMLQVSADELNFALWYIKQRGFAVNDDKSSMAITVDGMDYLEKNQPRPEAVMKFIKPDALVNPTAPVKIQQQPEPVPMVETKTGEPVLNALNRALQRHSHEEPLQRVPLRTR
jgi:curved DNA-binding protein CbpA